MSSRYHIEVPPRVNLNSVYYDANDRDINVICRLQNDEFDDDNSDREVDRPAVVCEPFSTAAVSLSKHS